MVAGDGWPYLILVGLVGAIAYRLLGPLWAIPFLLIEIALYFLFHDPWREVPPEPLGALAPIDGKIIDVCQYQDRLLPGTWVRITIATRHMGAYTIRAPIEGNIHDIAEEANMVNTARAPKGMWLRSEELHDVILMFPGGFRPLGPKAFVGYGERVGQGQRFAYLRLAPRAEVYLPPSSQVRVSAGDRVLAGETILADLPE